MNTLENLQVGDSRETVENEAHYNTFEVLMLQVDAGTLTFEEAVSTYQQRELTSAAQNVLSSCALQNS